MNKSLIYLATPYSHEDLAVQLDRFNQVNKLAAVLMGAGLHIYSPISHTHPIAVEGNLPTSWQYWEQYLRAILPSCAVLAVFMQDGWKQSTGVTAEIEIANAQGIPVVYIPAPFESDFEQLAIEVIRSRLPQVQQKKRLRAFLDYFGYWLSLDPR